MSHVRCFAHALVTAVALVSWGGVVWIGVYHGSAADPLRILGMSLIAIASVTTGLSLAPVVWIQYLKRYSDFLTTKAALEAAWNHGCAYGKQEERRKQEISRGARLHAVDTR